MTTRIAIPSFSLPLAAITLFCLGPFSVWAQGDGELAGVSVRIVSVKSDSAAQWEAAVKDLAASLQSQGVPFFHVYERLRGDNLPSYTVISQEEFFGELPEIDIDPQLINRILQASNGSTLLTVETYEEISIPPPSLEPTAPFLRTRVRVTSPANAEAYMAWQRELRDALQQAGLTDLRAGRVIMGGNSNTFVRWSFQDSISGGDGLDIAGTVGEREFERLIERGRALETSAEDYVLRFREDLSFTAAQ